MTTKVLLKILYGSYLVLFILSFFLVRQAVYSTNLVHEDGIFADIFLNQPAGPEYLQVGRVNGKEIYSAIMHPALNYEILRGAGFLAEQWIDFSKLTEYQTTFALRALFSLFQLFVWLLFIFSILLNGKNGSEANRWLLLAGVYIISMAPIAVDNSIDLQIDTTAGVLIIGLLCFSLMLRAFNILNGIPCYILLFITSVGVGFGKNEWSLVFILAVLLTGVLRFPFRKVLARTGYVLERDDLWLLVAAFTGCVLGNVISYLVDPYNYGMGWELMTRMTGTASIMGSSGIYTWVKMTLKRLPLISMILFLLVFALIRLIQHRRTLTLTQVLTLMISGCLFGAFFFSAWVGGGIRYFAPAFISSAAAAIIFFPREHEVVHKPWFAIISACLLGYCFFFYPNFPAYRPVQVFSQKGCIQILGVAQGYNRKDVDYIGDSVGPAQRDEIVKISGEPLCQP